MFPLSFFLLPSYLIIHLQTFIVFLLIMNTQQRKTFLSISIFLLYISKQLFSAAANAVWIVLSQSANKPQKQPSRISLFAAHFYYLFYSKSLC